MPDLVVLHRDARRLVVDKPAGLLSIPGRGPEHGPDARTLLEEQLGGPVWVVHRLDRGTSGAMAFALDAAAHRDLSMAFERSEVHKRYLALASGRVTDDAGEIDIPLLPARRGRMRPARAGESGKESLTRYRVLERFDEFTWLELRPTTGRQHQIRVHLSAIGHPLAVDEDYRGRKALQLEALGSGGGPVTLSRTPLHCAALETSAGGPALVVEAPVPQDMQAVLEALRKR